MSFPYELARRHYAIERILELEPGTRGFGQAAYYLQDLPIPLLVQVFDHSPDSYGILIPLCLLSRREEKQPESFSPRLRIAIENSHNDFCMPLVQELERLLHDEKLTRYPYARALILDELRFQRQGLKIQSGVFDRDRFRQYLSAYVQVLEQSGTHPHLLSLWSEVGWLKRWQIDSAPPHQALPVQSSPRHQIGRYQLSENAKLLYAQLDQGLVHAESFLAALPERLPPYLENYRLGLNTGVEQRLRDIVQVVMRHGVKKMFRIDALSRQTVLSLYGHFHPSSAAEQALLIYTLIQECLLGTQNLKYRLNDTLHGCAEALADLSQEPGSEARWHWAQQALLDGVMEIYESFSLADSALKAFNDHYLQAQGQLHHLEYLVLEKRLQALWSAQS